MTSTTSLLRKVTQLTQRRWVLTATPATDTELAHEMARQWNYYAPTYRFRGAAKRAAVFYARELRVPVSFWIRRASEIDDGR